MSAGAATTSEAYKPKGASAKYGRTGTIGLMLKSYKTWRRKRGYLATRGGRLPKAPPVATPLPAASHSSLGDRFLKPSMNAAPSAKKNTDHEFWLYLGQYVELFICN